MQFLQKSICWYRCRITLCSRWSRPSLYLKQPVPLKIAAQFYSLNFVYIVPFCNNVPKKEVVIRNGVLRRFSSVTNLNDLQETSGNFPIITVFEV